MIDLSQNFVYESHYPYTVSIYELGRSKFPHQEAICNNHLCELNSDIRCESEINDQQAS